MRRGRRFYCASICFSLRPADVSITFKLPLLHPFIIEWRQLNAELITLAPLAGYVLKNNYTLNKLWGAIHWITAFFSLSLFMASRDWVDEANVMFLSIPVGRECGSGGDGRTPAIYDRCTLAKRNPALLVECRATPYALCLKRNSLTSSHKCILNARWIK
jgi:hypothetical protein